MPKAILEFNLPEENQEFLLAQEAGLYHSALYAVDQRLRNTMKYVELTPEAHEIYEEMRKFLREHTEDIKSFY